MLESKGVSTSLSLSTTFSATSGSALSDPSTFRSIVGMLQYLMITHPDIAFVVNWVSQFMHKPTTEHWTAVKRLLRYLNSTSTFGLRFQPSSTLQLFVYSDADWACNPDYCKSSSGYAIFLGTNLISWASHKQHTIAKSSIEAEYCSFATATTELTWIQSLLGELGIFLPVPLILWCHNAGATYLTANPIFFHSRTKHLEVDFHFVRDKVASHNLESSRSVPPWVHWTSEPVNQSPPCQPGEGMHTVNVLSAVSRVWQFNQ
ncbi:PREDICTED: uncharacterized protein LOC109114206 [Nelumbo nucifera]|uniref:Uncharacterized protein LOC109114206 n=1 Tax=Nelumbo nucifera TaxID=4432 RepID=A0A1U8PZT7_NELNU|nr:PREDICTED: uncharacterized protein LOC109114206 [Nelumbo nucifera]